MNDRIFEALTRAGLSTSPLSTLDHASASASTFFALYDEELVYHEAGKTSRVPLQGVTRIHSDREGVLRVETSERTAVTASLLGYDPGRVQTFFQLVRDVTARAKELPVLPLNQAKVEPSVNTVLGSSLPPASLAGTAGLSGATAAGSVNPGMPGLSAYTPAVAPTAPVVVTPAPAVNSAYGSPVVPPSSASPVPPSLPANPLPANPLPAAPGAATSAAPLPVTPVPTTQTPPRMPPPVQGSAPPAPESARKETPRPEPVVISSMPPVSSPPAFQERAGERARQAATRTLPVAEPTPPVPAESPSVGASASPQEAHVHSQGPLVSAPVLSVPDQAGPDRAAPAQDLRPELLRRADSVEGLARTISLLAIVLGLAALALAFFQWQGDLTLNAIWTLLTGGVGTVALLAFAEALRLLAALSRRSAPQG